MKSSDYKKLKINPSAITRNPSDFDADTDNIYKSVAIMSKRANQISANLKEEFSEKLQDFRSPSLDYGEDTYENHEQIEWANYFEQLPKPTILATIEFLDNNTYYKKDN